MTTPAEKLRERVVAAQRSLNMSKSYADDIADAATRVVLEAVLRELNHEVYVLDKRAQSPENRYIVVRDLENMATGISRAIPKVQALMP